MQKKVKILFSILLSLFLVPGNLLAVGSAGFENASYSAKTLSQANAVVARSEDPSTVMFNPAGLTELPGLQVSTGLQALDFRTFHRNQATGDHQQSNAKLLLIPSFYLTYNPGEALDNRLAFGLSVNSPFGFRSSYPVGSVARYIGYDNYLEMIATTMAAAVKVTDWLSVGGGATHYYIYNYGQQFDYSNSAVLGFAATDGSVHLKTSGHGWGWKAGILLKPHEHHKIGVSYRSRANVKVKGQVRVEDLVLGSAQGFSTAPHFQTTARSDVPLPANLTLGYAYEPSEDWAVEFDVGWTGWSAFRDQDFEFDNTNAVMRTLGTVPRNYDDTWSFHLGGHKKISKKIDWRGGFAFFQAASPKKHVDNFLPDANRYLWTTGLGYELTKNINIDLNYMFMLFGSRHISNPQLNAKQPVNVDGRYTSIVHGAFLTLTYGSKPLKKSPEGERMIPPPEKKPVAKPVRVTTKG